MSVQHSVGVRIVGGHMLMPGDAQALCSCGWEGERHHRGKDRERQQKAGAMAQGEALAHQGGKRRVVERRRRMAPELVDAPEMFPGAK
jgi:hypothetical protein